MNQLKIGDKVYCIKDYIITSVKSRGSHNLKKGKIYQIEGTFPNSLGVNGKIFDTRKNTADYFFIFDDYFITMKELRKQKLLKLQNERISL